MIRALSLGLDLLKDRDVHGFYLLEDLLDRLKIDDAIQLRFDQLNAGATVQQLWN